MKTVLEELLTTKNKSDNSKPKRRLRLFGNSRLLIVLK